MTRLLLYLGFIFFFISWGSSTAQIKKTEKLSAHVFLEHGFPGMHVDVFYNKEKVYSGTPTDFSRASKAYSVHIGLTVWPEEIGNLEIRVKDLTSKTFKVDWSKHPSLAATLQGDEISILHPNTHGYR